MKSAPSLRLAVCAAFLCGAPAPAFAQDTDQATLAVELNTTSDTASGCQLSFVARNTLADSLSQVGFEMAFFDTQGALLRMSTLDFRDLPQKRTKIRQFVIPNAACNTLGRVLVNDVPVCEGLTAGTCYDGLSLTSRVSIKFEN
ncbi:MAG: hypothetical protein AAF903_14445 [Pseudomonadota bacterium]